jgi:peptidoglycan/LPS O-acetylase OafA/YrhL
LGNKNTGYMIQLDSLRAIAVINVMFVHFTPANIPNSFASALNPIYDWFPGVPLFFVLSGFLITGILLRLRDDVNSNQQSLSSTLRIFYIRRFLRISPLYYLTLFVTAIIFKQVRNIFFWHLTYTTNIMVFLRGSFDETSTHLWSLSVEEQFYIVWPFVILLIPKKHLLTSILATIILAVVSRFGCYFFGLNDAQITCFPLTYYDSLGLGALLALFTHHQNRWQREKQNLCKIGLYLCFPVLIFFAFFQEVDLLNLLNISLFNLLIKPTILAFFYVWLVNRAAEGFGGLVGKFLELKLLVFIGKISYGLYVIHYFMIPLLGKLYWYFDLTNKMPVSTVILLNIGTTFAFAVPSWFWFEKPINDLKRRFSYKT